MTVAPRQPAIERAAAVSAVELGPRQPAVLLVIDRGERLGREDVEVHVQPPPEAESADPSHAVQTGCAGSGRTAASSRTVTVSSIDGTPAASSSGRSRAPMTASDAGSRCGSCARSAVVDPSIDRPRSRPSSMSAASPVIDASGGQASSCPSTNNNAGGAPEASAQPASAPMRIGQSPPIRSSR